jgi:formate dehydrogenase major subunit
MISLTIDGKKVEVPEGTTVLRAAQAAGIEIPTLCDHAHLSPIGACRLCIVEVEGARVPQPSCTLPVSNGMVVRTDTPQLRESRKFILTLLFSERNHFCMYCQMSGGDCELQNAAYRENMTHWPLQTNWQPLPVDASHEHFVLDHNRCILCRRCVRACGELVGNFTLGMMERGADTMLIADLGVPLGESSCISCGTCVQVCPTGALIERASAYRGRDKEVQRVKSICLGCSVGCGVELITRDNQLVRIEGDWTAPVNGGVLCEVGRFLPLNEERERLVTPLVRKNGSLKAATWDEALDLVASRLKPLAHRKGDGVAALASTRLPIEALHLFSQLFAARLGSEMVTSIEEGMTTALPGAVAHDLGGPFEGNLEALQSSDCIVAIGANLTENHQVVGFFAKRARPRGTKLVVIDPAENDLQKLADIAVRPKKGTDYELLMGIMAEVVHHGWAKGVEPNLSDLARFTPYVVSQKTGVSEEVLLAVARLITSAQKPAFVYGKGITGRSSPQALKALLDLARLVGALNNEASAVLSVKGEANSQGAYLYGLDIPFQVNGHQAVFLALGDDRPSQRLTQRVEGAPFVAVLASYVSSLTAMADVVLPVEMWAEQEGHYINMEGRLQEAHAALRPPEEVRSPVNVLQSLASRMGLDLDGDWKALLHKRMSSTPIWE